MNIPSVISTRFEDYHDALAAACRLWKIEPGYWDIWGNHHLTLPDVQRSILESLGLEAGSLEELNAAMEQRLWRQWSRLTDPVLVKSENAAESHFMVRVPAALENSTIHVELEWEDEWKGIFEHSLSDMETTATAELRGQWFVEKRVLLTRSPLGYHRLRVWFPHEGPDAPRGEMRLIVTPDRVYTPPGLSGGGKRAGLNISLYGIRSARSWGCGDFTDLQRLAGWVGKRIGGSFIGLNPLHALHNRQPFNTSPYLPNCIYYQNLIYLDVEKIEDYRKSGWARALRQRPRVKEEIAKLNAAEFVEYECVSRLKRSFLKLAFRRFRIHEWKTDSARAREFRRFIEDEGELLDRYATYSALDEWLHGKDPSVWTWPYWPKEYRTPESLATREFARKYERAILFHKYVQWQIDLQLAEAQATARREGLSIGLFHDLALATDSMGADLWAHGDFFVSGCRVGAPPDDFSPKGQNWSFPPPASGKHWEDGYHLFRESIRKTCRHGGALRIDHVMRFFRLFWIPEGKEAIEGTYVREHAEDLLRILALESVRNKVLVVGEDLGTVEPEIREKLAEFGVLSYRLFYFEKNEHGDVKDPKDYPAQALVSSTTHDLPTLAGFWSGEDIESRREAGVFPDEHSYRQAVDHRRGERQKMLDALFRLRLLPNHVPRTVDQLPKLTGDLHNAIIGYLASTPSMLLSLNQEDLTKETAQQNLPGTTATYPNWRRKMRYSLEELESLPSIRDFVNMFRHWLEKSGRIER